MSSPLELRKKRVTVTGGHGFLGSFVMQQLAAAGARVTAPPHRDYDLLDPGAARRLYEETRPDILIHLAARVGGIGANRAHPGTFFYDNMAMGLHVIEEARRYARLEKLVLVGTTCSYPKLARVPMSEDQLWDGYPEETNAPYGIAKKALLVMAEGYRAEYGLSSIYVIPTNLYGPRDRMDLETSHVIPALIRRFIDAKEAGAPAVTLWGSGEATRQFLYVEDGAEGILLAAARYADVAPVNLAGGEEISIRDLAARLRVLTDYAGEIVWDRSKPDGQPRRALDGRRAQTAFGFTAKTRLEDGLRRTLEWYQDHRASMATA